jgi:TfoX/Sxy family transcriptional regulator of competence genes
MPVDDRLAARVRRVLAGRPDVEEKRMFGGLAFMVRGHMAVGVVKSSLMVRSAPDEYERLLADDHARPMDFTGTPLKGFLFVDPDGFATAPALKRWVGRGVAFAESRPTKTRRMRRPAAGRPA